MAEFEPDAVLSDFTGEYEHPLNALVDEVRLLNERLDSHDEAMRVGFMMIKEAIDVLVGAVNQISLDQDED